MYHPRYFLVPKISMPLHGLLMYLGCLRCVEQVNREWPIEQIDAHFMYPDGFAAVLLGRRLGIPVTISARGTDINVYPKFWSIRPMIRWTLKNADGLIAVSSALRNAMVELGGASGKTRVIGNGVDAERFQPMSRDEARSKLKLPRAGPIIVSVGALIPSKGQEYLIRAFGELSKANRGMQLYLIGEGPERELLERVIRELRLEGSVHLPGKRPNEELRLWFCAAEFSCLISAREGWPNVLTESLACGTPVVASKVGGIPEIIRSEDFGILVEQNVESVASGIQRALSKKWDRSLISRENRARSWDKVADEVMEMFRLCSPA